MTSPTTAISVRLARHSELILVDALLGSHEWVARDVVGIILEEPSSGALLGAAVLRALTDNRRPVAFLLQYRLVEDEPNPAWFAALLDFATIASVRSGVGFLEVHNVPSDSIITNILINAKFQKTANTLMFRGEISYGHEVTRGSIAKRAKGRPNVELVPFLECSPVQFMKLCASHLGVVGLGVRALQADDREVLKAFSQSWGAVVGKQLVGGVVAMKREASAFIEMIVVDRLFAPLSVVSMLIERCTASLLASGATSYEFSTSADNKQMCRLAQHLRCKQVGESTSWIANLRD